MTSRSWAWSESQEASFSFGPLAQLPQFEGLGTFFEGSTEVKSAELRGGARESRV